jgi:hypothetical protein
MLRNALLVAPALVGLATAQQAPERIALKVTVLGDDEARAERFATFLRERFADVAVEKHGADPKTFAGRDVVVVDWKQDVKAIQDKSVRSPLGARADWRTPTVLLGSAGLNLACAWEVLGGFG